MKVSFLNRRLWKEYYKVLTAISVVVTLLSLFIQVPDNNRLCFFIGAAIVAIGAFLCLWFRANRVRKATLNINNSTLEIDPGDIFEEEGFKVIAFNEFFDTQVGEIINENTVNGKYILRVYPQISDLDAIISADTHARDCIIEEKRRTGKTARYKLGTIIKNGDYFLLAFSRFDETNRAFLEINDYIDCLMNMWNECDIHYGGGTVVLPLLGAGITRFRGYENITEQELLEIIIWTFKTSHIRFQYPAKAKVVLTEDSLKKINLYDIKEQFK